MLSNTFLLGAAIDFCSGAKDIMKFISTIFFIFKIAIPILLIIWGSIDLGKAVVAQDEKEIKSATEILIKRAIIGLVIFFVPTIVGLVFGLLGDFQDDSEIKAEYDKCADCIKSPSACDNL